MERTDELLDEIDAVLDEAIAEVGSAEEFVRDYVQKGGE